MGDVVDLRARSLRVHRRERVEFSASGPDLNFQLQGSDPYRGVNGPGLIIPTAPSTSPSTRYLFLLARTTVAVNEIVFVRGLRQLVTIGYAVPGAVDGDPAYVLEQEITSPWWRFQGAGGGSISWHLMKVNPGVKPIPSTSNTNGQMFRYAHSSALIYETPTSGGYVAPSNGRPPGNVVTPDLGCFHDLRYPWRDDHASTTLCVPVVGPCDICFFASVWQTDPSTNVKLNNGSNKAVPPEDTFFANWPLSRYYRIAGAMTLGQE